MFPQLWSIFWALISWSWSRDMGFHKSSRLNGRPTTVHTMRVTSCQNANVFILQFVLQRFLQLITIKIIALSLERRARSPKPSWWIFPVFYGSRATSRWWRETLCQLMRRHMAVWMLDTCDIRTHMRWCKTNEHTRAPERALLSRSIWFFEIEWRQTGLFCRIAPRASTLSEVLPN